MNAKHTKGPWRTERYMGRADSWFVRGPQDERVCGSGSGPVIEANARLIASAPELLDVLLDIFEREETQVAFAGNPLRIEALVAKAHSAISKARGESND